MLEQLFGCQKDQIRHLDYGGGNGGLSKRLSQSGWNSHSFDPFPKKGQAAVGDLGKFNLITAFEVFEHVPDPKALIRNLSGLMEDDAVILFSTLLTDGHVEAGKKLSWWYASPRNGHISLFSKKSLQTLQTSHANDLHLVSFNEGFHGLFRTIPEWARHVLRQTSP